MRKEISKKNLTLCCQSNTSKINFSDREADYYCLGCGFKNPTILEHKPFTKVKAEILLRKIHKDEKENGVTNPENRWRWLKRRDMPSVMQKEVLLLQWDEEWIEVQSLNVEGQKDADNIYWIPTSFTDKYIR